MLELLFIQVIGGMEIYAERLFNCIKNKGNIDCNMKNDIDDITNKKFFLKKNMLLGFSKIRMT